MPETVIDVEILEARAEGEDLASWFKKKKMQEFWNKNRGVIVVGGLTVGGLLYWAYKARGR